MRHIETRDLTTRFGISIRINNLQQREETGFIFQTIIHVDMLYASHSTQYIIRENLIAHVLLLDAH
jgi:hypothetical protein